MPSAREPRYKAYQRELQGNAAQGIAGSIAEEKVWRSQSLSAAADPLPLLTQ